VGYFEILFELFLVSNVAMQSFQLGPGIVLFLLVRLLPVGPVSG
jgi:hypothetical protein